MLNQTAYQIALKFAAEKHCDQTVPGSPANYVLHLSNVAMEVMVAYMNEPNFDINLAIQLALLHDTLEDTSTTFQDLTNHFSEQLAHGVLALTKDASLPTKEAKMLDSLKRIQKSCKEVAIVKLADRITNLQPPPLHWDQEKVMRYQKEAVLIANTLQGYHNYLTKRLRQKINTYTLNKQP